MTFAGLYTPLITPFKENHLDEEGLQTHIKRQEEAGVSGLVLFGTTAEIQTLTDHEQQRILDIAKESFLPIIIGCNEASTQRLVEKVSRVKNVQGLMISAPCYSRPTQEGLYQHFAAAARATDLPIIVYNNPVRAAVNIEPRTLERLAKVENIVAVKECHPAQASAYALNLLCGNDDAILSMIAMGAQGAIASTANIIPAEMVAFVKSCLEGDFEIAREWHYRLLPLFQMGGGESNPIPCKAAMNLMGFAAGEPRLPLLPSTKVKEIEEVLWKLGFLVAPGR